MVEGGSGTRFAAEALQRQMVLRHLIGQEFQSDEAAQIGVFSLVNHTHAAATDLLHNAIVRDCLADHWQRILRGEIRQVNESRGVGAIFEVSRADASGVDLRPRSAPTNRSFFWCGASSIGDEHPRSASQSLSLGDVLSGKAPGADQTSAAILFV